MVNKNLEEQIQTIFFKEFISRDSFPHDWSQGNLLDIADYINGLAMQKFRPLNNEQGLPVIKIRELRQGYCDTSSEQCSESIKDDYIINSGDVIFSWSGSLLVDFWCGEKSGLNQHLFKVTSSKFDKWFYYSWTKYHLNKFIAIANDKATTMGHIKRKDLKEAKVVIPSQEDYHRIGSLLKPMCDLVINNRIECNRLISLRNNLLPKLISGEIDISSIIL